MSNAVMLLMGLVLVSGCSHKKLDSMQEQLDRMEAKIDQIKNENIKEIDNLANTFASKMEANTAIMRTNTVMVQESVAATDHLASIEEAAFKARTNQPPPKQSVRPAIPPRPEQLKHGIPSSIYDTIAENAAKRFPNDYDEQVFIINEQVEAYLKLNGR